MEITLYRDQPIQRGERMLPAALYNLASTLIHRSRTGTVFVPIRSMQYLAILDADEYVFVDNQYRDQVEIAWQHFHPEIRVGLDTPVPYELAIYHPDGLVQQQRLMSEFPKALQQLAGKDRPEGPAKVLKFERRQAKVADDEE